MKKNNITYIYPPSKRKAVLMQILMQSRFRLYVAYLKKYYYQAMRNYHAWRIESIKKKGERMNRRHENRLARLEKRYNK